VGLLKAQGARLERRGSNFQKPPREELKLGGVRKAENASGKTQPVVQWALGCITVTAQDVRLRGARRPIQRAQSRREDCSAAAAPAAGCTCRRVVRNSACTSTVSPLKPGLVHLSACINPLRRVRRSTGTLLYVQYWDHVWMGGGRESYRTHRARQQAWRPGGEGRLGEARGGEGRREEGCSALAK